MLHALALVSASGRLLMTGILGVVSGRFWRLLIAGVLGIMFGSLWWLLITEALGSHVRQVLLDSSEGTPQC